MYSESFPKPARFGNDSECVIMIQLVWKRIIKDCKKSKQTFQIMLHGPSIPTPGSEATALDATARNMLGYQTTKVYPNLTNISVSSTNICYGHGNW